MSKTTVNSSGQKVTTHYDDEKVAEQHADRRNLNREIRDKAQGKSPDKPYRSVGESRAIDQYDKAPSTGSASAKKPAGVFQRVANAVAPSMTKEAAELGKVGPARLAGRAVGKGIVNTGARVGSLMGQNSIPVWLQDQRRGKSKYTKMSGAELPAWIYGGGMPWDQPRQSSTVEKVIVTRVHADGTRTTTTRAPTQNRSHKPRRPDWIRF
jgi:hypothetical protein